MVTEQRERLIALAGNPNVGKSTLFNRLTGMRQHTGNWPGKTVAVAQGRTVHNGQGYILTDLPGTYSIVSNSPEEEVARDFICSGGAEATIVVCDATCLERSLNLAIQIISICPRTIVCVNLADEAEESGIKIDDRLLERRLGVPVVMTAARSGRGVPLLLDRLEAILNKPASFSAAVYPDEHPVQTARQIAEGCITVCCDTRLRRQRKLDHLLTSRATGIPIMLAMLALVLWLTIAGANYPSQLLSSLLFGWEDNIRAALLWLGSPQWLAALAVDGVYRVLAWVVSVMLPPMAIFFPIFTLLEDLGYLPRVAFNLDGVFQRCRACGKQGLSMCMDNIKLQNHL